MLRELGVNQPTPEKLEMGHNTFSSYLKVPIERIKCILDLNCYLSPEVYGLTERITNTDGEVILLNTKLIMHHPKKSIICQGFD